MKQTIPKFGNVALWLNSIQKNFFIHFRLIRILVIIRNSTVKPFHKGEKIIDLSTARLLLKIIQNNPNTQSFLLETFFTSNGQQTMHS
jgi:hypothetical protein